MNTYVPRPASVDWLEACVSDETHFEAHETEPAELLTYIQHLEAVRSTVANLIGVGFMRVDAPARYQARAKAVFEELRGMLHPPADDAPVESAEG